jgi:gamma-glutamyltranspeptidase/glutathione hydrolase
VIDFGLDPQAAIDRPHAVNLNGPTRVEPGAEDLAAALSARGHEVETRDLNSGLHLIAIGPDGMTGAADKRREGMVLGD